MAALDAALEAARTDEAVGVVVVTGSGEKSFIAGADIGELSKLSPLEGREHARRGQAVVAKLESLGKPVIAAVNGYALGGGCELALACTIRIASENARFGQPEVKLGIIPGYGGSQRLARVVGEGRAMQLCLTAEQIDAAEAYRIGLVNKVVPAGQALAAAKDMAKAILSNGPVACRYVLEAVRRGLEMPLSEGLVFEATLFGLCAATSDMKEGMTAFLEKRPARFTGR
jgi:enoyl-CoA hydratase